VINLRVVDFEAFFLDHLESSDLSFDSESYDSNTKIYPVRIWVKIASSHPLIFSLSIYPFGFELCIWNYPWLIFNFNYLIHQKTKFNQQDLGSFSSNQIDLVKPEFNWYLFDFILFLPMIIFCKIDI